jgi:hypothetical protein
MTIMLQVARRKIIRNGFAIWAVLWISILTAQTPPSASQPEHQRIFGVLPNFLTVSDPQQATEPLSFKQKLTLFAKQTYDPVTFASAAAGAGLSQAQNGDPQYGAGAGPYTERFGAAMADISSQNFFGGVLLSSAFHEDPRYFRRGPKYSAWNRLGYALSRVAITRTDAGKQRFNYSGVIGMSMGIALSNAYYPDSSVNGSEIASRFATSLMASALYNILPEFWPDIRQKFSHRKATPNQDPRSGK